MTFREGVKNVMKLLVELIMELMVRSIEYESALKQHPKEGDRVEEGPGRDTNAVFHPKNRDRNTMKVWMRWAQTQ